MNLWLKKEYNQLKIPMLFNTKNAQNRAITISNYWERFQLKYMINMYLYFMHSFSLTHRFMQKGLVLV